MMNMKKVYMFLANGFEDVEALIPLDVLRRGGVDVKTVSITGSLVAESAHGVRVEADLMFETADVEDADLLMLPGGMPGASNLNDHEGVKEALLAQAQAGKLVSAICAAPLVLGGLGLLKGKRATWILLYPRGFPPSRSEKKPPGGGGGMENEERKIEVSPSATDWNPGRMARGSVRLLRRGKPLPYGGTWVCCVGAGALDGPFVRHASASAGDS